MGSSPASSRAGHDVIRTPDQRLRVFVSSTLQELGPEREAVRAAFGNFLRGGLVGLIYNFLARFRSARATRPCQ